MLLANLLKVALRSILRNRMRSLLTSLGVIIGVSAVIVMAAMGRGSQELIEREITSLGTNLLIVFPGASRTGNVNRGAGSLNRLTYDDVEKIRAGARLIERVAPIVRSGGQVVGGGKNWSTEVCGTSNEYFRIRDWKLAHGDYFTEKDIKVGRKVALLGKTVADELFPDQDPTGERVRIRKIPFTIIGVLEAKGQTGVGQDQDDIIYAPWTTVLHRLKGGRYIDLINASAVSPEALEDAESEMDTILRASHRLDAGEESDFMIHNQTEITQAVTSTSRIMTWLLGAIASVSLLVGGIGIMNIMLVSVTERTREIGIRLSVGARGVDILVQFLAEATTLSLGGGLIGVLLALLVAFVLNRFTGLYALVSADMVVVAFLFSGAVGMFFGYYPARKASRLNPIDALRYE